LIQRAIWAAVVAAIGLAGAASATDETGGQRACGLPAGLTALDGRLPHAAAALTERHALKIVAFGSSSTYGTGASGPAATYPSRLEAALGQLFPDAQLAVTNRGVPGEVATDMMARLDHDVIAPAPDLVIWQTGTNDAMQDIPVEQFARLTLDGIARLHDAGIDVVLMEPQYSPKLVRQPHYADFVETLRTIGHVTGTPLVRRFDMMEAWVASGRFDDATMLQSDSLHMRDASYACLGQAVAVGLAEAIADSESPTGRLTAEVAPAR
jgi:lysophospholipase L1-like esterase